MPDSFQTVDAKNSVLFCLSETWTNLDSPQLKQLWHDSITRINSTQLTKKGFNGSCISNSNSRKKPSRKQSKPLNDEYMLNHFESLFKINNVRLRKYLDS